MSGTLLIRHQLKHPVGEVTHVELRRAKGKDYKGLAAIPDRVEQAIIIMSRLSGHPVELFEEMDGEDFYILADAAGADVERRARR